MLPSRIFFDNFFDDLEPSRKMDKMMKCDIYEKDGKYTIEMDVPGFKKEDIKMELSNGYLTISAEKTQESDESDDKKYLRRERKSYEKCERQFYVGDVDDADVKAEFKDGILTIVVPKETKEEESKKVINID